MFTFILKKIIGSKNDREVKRLRPLVVQINEFEQQFQSLTDDALRAKTAEWKARIEAERQQRGYNDLMQKARQLESELNSEAAKLERRKAYDVEQEILNELLPEAFAVVKNACRRLLRQAKIMVRDHQLAWDMIPFDVQLIGGIALHRGKIAEMATGEGKTLVATLPVYLNALTGRGVHVVTVNDYLAARDSEWMGAVYKFLGPDRRLHPARPAARACAASSTTATSPTAPTPSSASITCATTAWPRARRSRSSAAITTPSSTRWTRS